ncbi:MAG: hypothetical protein M3R07_03830 [Gemmatimonadota bacterium]|nr:hypothetical protein [Gemmatimonadota bacterium]
MSDTATVSGNDLDSIIEQLDRFHQRATYGAVAAIVDKSPRSLMSGRERNPRSSWIVSRESGAPSGYSEEQLHPALEERENILSTPGALRGWLENPA